MKNIKYLFPLSIALYCASGFAASNQGLAEYKVHKTALANVLKAAKEDIYKRDLDGKMMSCINEKLKEKIFRMTLKEVAGCCLTGLVNKQMCVALITDVYNGSVRLRKQEQEKRNAAMAARTPSVELCDIFKDTKPLSVDCSNMFPDANMCEKSCVANTWRYKITSCKYGLNPSYDGMTCIGTRSEEPTPSPVPQINPNRKAGAACASDELPEHATAGYYIKSSAGLDGLKCAASACQNGYYVPEKNGVPQGWCRYGTDPKILAQREAEENARLEAEKAEYQARLANAPMESGKVQLLTVAPVAPVATISMPGREVSNPAPIAENKPVTPAKTSGNSSEERWIKTGPLADANMNEDSGSYYGKTGSMDF